MKIAITADWHLGVRSIDKLESTKRTIHNLINKCIDESIDYIVVAGDIYHNKSIIYTDIQSELLDIIRSYRTIKFVIIDGNHDLSSRGVNSQSALKSLDFEPNVIRISEPLKIGDFLFCPFSYNINEIIKSNSSKYLISHFGLNEATLSSGCSIKSDISLNDLLGKYEVVICGHYHKPQEINKRDITFIYTGSIIQLDLSERNEDKRFIIFDSATGKIDSYPTEGWSRYYLFKISKDNKDEVISRADQLISDGHYVYLEKDDDVNLNDVTSKFKIIQKPSSSAVNRGIRCSMSMREKLEKYLQIKNIDESEHESYINEALSIIAKCEE